MHTRLWLRAAVASVVLVLSAGIEAQDHAGRYSQAEIDVGLRVYNAQCTLCHGPNGDLVTGIDLRRGLFRRALANDDDLAQAITTGAPAAGMPPVALRPPELTGIIAFIRAGFDTTASVTVGSATRGQTIFEGKGACGTCHRVNGRGPRKAPDLSEIGLARTAAALQRSVLEPTSAMLPINRPVRIVTKAGETIMGRRLNEDTYTVQLIDDQERLRSIAKSDMRTFVVETTSPMPSYAQSLTADDIADVVAYLLTLKERWP